MLGERRMVQKRCFYEWSARIPLVVRVPAGRRGATIAEPVSLLDVGPTLLELAGVEPEVPPDGVSLAPLLDGGRAEDRAVLSEYHVEKVRAPCFMARKGRHKYVLVHGHGEQLFDLEADPGEWASLAGQDETREVEQELRALVLARCDPDAIAADGERSVRRREVSRPAMARNGTSGDYSPVFDATKQYVR